MAKKIHKLSKKLGFDVGDRIFYQIYLPLMYILIVSYYIINGWEINNNLYVEERYWELLGVIFVILLLPVLFYPLILLIYFILLFACGLINDNMKNKTLLLKIAVGIYIAIILYLFALNGRYERIANGAVLDKWKKEVVAAGSEELPLKK